MKRNNRKKPVLVLFFLMMSLHMQQGFAQLPTGVTVNKIWDKSPSNAFTDLIYFKGRYFCTFRESDAHVFGKNGTIRVISSPDGVKWDTVANLEKSGYDLRDPKLSITPDGRLMLLMGGSIYRGKELTGRYSQVSFSDKKGRNFSAPQPITLSAEIASDLDWLWRVTWHGKIGYGVLYQLNREDGQDWKLYLVKTTDGVHYTSVTQLDVADRPNETTLRIMPDGEMLMMVRKEAGDKKGHWGRSQPPYTDWKWTPLNTTLGGPNFISLDDSILVAGTRLTGMNGPYTGLMVGSRKGDFQRVIALPSGGDNSYPGLVLAGDTLFVSYYASHEVKTSIYLAKVPVQQLRESLKAPEVLSSSRIWGPEGEHCAFTDLTKYKGRYYCTFREATGHVPGVDGEDGKIRVIVSDDMKEWKSAALIAEAGIDLRDPKLTISPKNELMITCGGSDYDGEQLREWHTRVMYSDNGMDWSRPQRVRGIPSNNWFFRLTWHNGVGYVAANICASLPRQDVVIANDRKLIVFKTLDGLNYEQVSKDFAPHKLACEATIRFKDDSTMWILIRNAHGIDEKWSSIAYGTAPYHDFNTITLDHGLGGPNFLFLPNNSCLIATREWRFERPNGRSGLSNVLLSVDEYGITKRLFELTSGGNDTGYPGLLIEGDKLWISYYSSHEGEDSAIYLISLPLGKLN